MLKITEHFFDFSVADLARYQLMNQRSIPGFVPSQAAYAPSVEVMRNLVERMHRLGVTESADIDLYLAFAGALVDMQLANDPGGDRTFAEERPMTAALDTRPRTSALDRDVAMQLATTEYERVVALLDGLSARDWAKPTDCPEWDVRALAAHMLGMAEMSASVRESMRQVRAVEKSGGVFIDALTALQVSERTDMTPTAIAARYAEVPPAR